MVGHDVKELKSVSAHAEIQVTTEEWSPPGHVLPILQYAWAIFFC
jgi:hypothetical protein